MKRLITLCTALLLALGVCAQNQVRDSSLFNPHFSVSLAYQVPGGDLADRFGTSGSPGIGFHIKSRSNWYYGVQAQYIFGNRVNEPGLLGNLRTDRGEVLDDQGQIAIVFLQQRGYTVMLECGRLIPVLGPNRNSGILLKGGAGLMQHKIRIEHQTNPIAQLEGEYLKGYDRLTNGLAITQFIGYYHMSNNRLLNFFVGVESQQGFTRSRRGFNFDTQTADTRDRLDILLGLRAGWCLHLYRRLSDEYFYY
ncbi:MAG: hypothetical protein ACK5XV_07195 [Flavobacteriales bacterium]